MGKRASRPAIKPKQVFGKWTVIKFAHRLHLGHKYYQCRCVCGREVIVDGNNLLSRRSTQCKPCSLKTHGLSKTNEYDIWQGLHSRCYNPNVKGFKNWGARGIKVCDRWTGESGFINFLADMGPRPSLSHSVEREDVNGNYAPENCRWATREEQNRNKRKAGALTSFSNGEIQTEFLRRKIFNIKDRPMARITIVECDAEGCAKKCEIRDQASPEVFTVLQVTDTMGKSFWFCGATCLQKWIDTYKSPYSPELAEIPPEAIPEFEN